MPRVATKAKQKKAGVKLKVVKGVAPSKPKPKPSTPKLPTKPGRKPKGKNPMGAYTLNLGEKFKNECMQYAKKEGASLSKIIIQALQEYMAK